VWSDVDVRSSQPAPRRTRRRPPAPNHATPASSPSCRRSTASAAAPSPAPVTVHRTRVRVPPQRASLPSAARYAKRQRVAVKMAAPRRHRRQHTTPAIRNAKQSADRAVCAPGSSSGDSLQAICCAATAGRGSSRGAIRQTRAPHARRDRRDTRYVLFSSARRFSSAAAQFVISSPLFAGSASSSLF